MANELTIINGSNKYFPCVEDGITWETERKGIPGKLTFNVVQDELLKIEEGNEVRFKKDNNNVFRGFIFTLGRNKDETVKVTAYNQLRYFKNKDSYIYSNKKANEFISMIAKDYELNVGTLEDTGYVIPMRNEDNSTLFDMIDYAITETNRNTNKLYVLYDDFGKLQLKYIEDMRLPLLYGKDTLEDFEYTSSIDSNTYNQIKLAYDNKDTGKREIYITKDSENINKWGLLQYYEKIDTQKVDGKSKANILLKNYNKKTKTLSINNCLGDVRVQAGFGIMVELDLIDIKLKKWMTIEKAKHTFKDNEHLMDLTLRGGLFSV